MSWKLDSEPLVLSGGCLWLIHNTAGKEMARSFNKRNAERIANLPWMEAACRAAVEYIETYGGNAPVFETAHVLALLKRGMAKTEEA